MIRNDYGSVVDPITNVYKMYMSYKTRYFFSFISITTSCSLGKRLFRPIPVVLGWRHRYALDKLSVSHRASTQSTFTPLHTRFYPSYWAQTLDWGRCHSICRGSVQTQGEHVNCAQKGPRPGHQSCILLAPRDSSASHCTKVLSYKIEKTSSDVVQLTRAVIIMALLINLFFCVPLVWFLLFPIFDDVLVSHCWQGCLETLYGCFDNYLWPCPFASSKQATVILFLHLKVA